MHRLDRRLYALTGALSIALFACGGAKPATSGASGGRDDFGNVITVGHENRPKRIVSLNPTTTEILFAIGAGSRVVGRSTYDVFPKEAAAVTDVGMPLRPNVEAVLAVHPDLVILYASNDNRPAAERFQQAGVIPLALKIDSIAQFERDTRLLGRLTGDSAAAYALVDSVAATLDRVRAATANLPHPTVFIPTWDRPLIAIGGGSFLSQLLDAAGGRNIYEDIATPSAVVTIEDVAKRNPDYVLTSPAAAPNIGTDPKWRALSAVRQKHVLIYDTLLVGRPSVTLGAAARSLADLLHPGAVR
ncbi:MAG TPA: helical backbone metal receptor [Gemmatimonadaceae bacterium]|jgi:iron complex transport system substrate-binding protein|nr:helical backbone metal receptor [Gemmatimonadaceae bacterium]